MAEKQFQSTPKRREDARKKGQVVKSQELTSSLMILGFVTVFRYWIPFFFEQMNGLFQFIYRFNYHQDNVILNLSSLIIMALKTFGLTMAPILGIALFVALLANFVQVRFMITFEPLKPQLSRISPLNGAKRMFGLKAWVELAKSLLKVLFMGYFLYATVQKNMETFPLLQEMNFMDGILVIGDMVIGLCWKIAIAFVFISVLDYIYQWWSYEKDLKMSHEEMKEEFKQTEGNPQIKSEVKRRQRAMAMNRMMQDLIHADVVITNPTHFAVALKYDALKKKVPFVIAKGQDELAQKIKTKAREYNIPLVENVPLARALYAQVEIGEGIPNTLYKAVAEILAFVYRLKKSTLKEIK